VQNAHDNVLRFQELFFPIIDSVAKLETSFDHEMKLTGEKAAQLTREYQQNRRKIEATIPAGTKTRIEKRVKETLSKHGYEVQHEEGRDYFLVTTGHQDGDGQTVTVSINPQNTIVFQSYSKDLADRGIEVLLSDFMIFSNSYSMGNFHLNQDKKRVIYRYGLDVNGIEDEFPPELVNNIMQEQYLKGRTHLQGFSLVNQRYDDPADIMVEIFGIVKSVTTTTPEEPVPPVQEEAEEEIDYPVFQEDEYEEVKTEPQSTWVAPGKSLKSKSTAILLEVLPGLIGILGIGWFYAGKTGTGILVLIGMLIWDVVALAIGVGTVGIGLLCLAPVHLVFIGVSSFMLNNYAKNHPELFE
jgi:TM2 domain-containing membrane protein YozV